jgi:hypothetical protein
MKEVAARALPRRNRRRLRVRVGLAMGVFMIEGRFGRVA